MTIYMNELCTHDNMYIFTVVNNNLITFLTNNYLIQFITGYSVSTIQLVTEPGIFYFFFFTLKPHCILTSYCTTEENKNA